MNRRAAKLAIEETRLSHRAREVRDLEARADEFMRRERALELAEAAATRTATELEERGAWLTTAVAQLTERERELSEREREASRVLARERELDERVERIDERDRRLTHAEEELTEWRRRLRDEEIRLHAEQQR